MQESQKESAARQQITAKDRENARNLARQALEKGNSSGASPGCFLFPIFPDNFPDKV